MAFITLNTEKLRKNFEYLDNIFKENGIEWAVVSKLLCGNKEFLNELLKMGARQFCDSRLSNLKMIKSLSEATETIYIKPPPKRLVNSVVRFADISLNTEIDTIEMLSEAAKEQNKVHKVIIMIEMGELREGVLKEDLIAFYERVFELPNIEVIGLGTNLTCMYGVLPSHDKLIQLCLYEQLIEAKFHKELRYVSGGSSVTIPLLFENLLPKGVNHFRVGETLFLGTNVFYNTTFDEMHNDVFQLFAEIIELNEKSSIPVGELGYNLMGKQLEFDESARGDTSFRAIIDVGLLDIDQQHIKPKLTEHKVVGASSDMLVIDLGVNASNLQVGDMIEMEMDYMGVLRILNSKYIDKKVV